MGDMQTSGLPDLDIDLLRTFLAVSETKSFTRAAQQVFRTPSAVSMQIKKLEEIVERPLFIRDSRSVHLTADGEALSAYARRILKLNAEAVRHFRSPPIEGVIRIGSPDDFGTRRLPAILARFAQTHPGVQVDVFMEATVRLHQMMDKGELDLTLITVSDGDRDEDDDVEIVATEKLVWAGLKGGCAHERDPVPLALAEQGCAWRSAAFSALEQQDLAYRVAYSSPHWAGQKAAILADLAIAPFPISLIEAPLRKLDERQGLPSIGTYQIGLRRSPNLGPAAAAFADHVTSSFSDEQWAPNIC